MLEVKNGDIKVNQEDVDTSIAQNDESFFWTLWNEDITDKSNGWQQKLDHKGNINFKMYQRPPYQKGKDPIARSDVFYNNIKVETMFEFFRNLDKHMDTEMIEET